MDRMPRRMIGWWQLEPLPAAAADPLFAALPRPTAALHWNEDSFEPPAGSVELLPRPGPGAEAFRAGHCAWGIQFHPEADADLLETWYEMGGDSLRQAGVAEREARERDAAHLPRQAETAQALFGAFARLAAGDPSLAERR